MAVSLRCAYDMINVIGHILPFDDGLLVMDWIDGDGKGGGGLLVVVWI